MEVIRATITGWSASFRYPTFMYNYHKTMEIPPLSTVYGLLSSAKGEIVTPEDTKIGYIFEYDAQGTDLEFVYELAGKLGYFTNILRRDFLYNYTMYLYLTNLDFAEILRKPKHALLLGRSYDLASITEIKKIKLERKKNVRFGKTIVPFGVEKVSGVYFSLPVYFDYETLPRKPVEIKEFLIVDRVKKNYELEVFYDKEIDWGVWIHNE